MAISVACTVPGSGCSDDADSTATDNRDSGPDDGDGRADASPGGSGSGGRGGGRDGGVSGRGGAGGDSGQSGEGGEGGDGGASGQGGQSGGGGEGGEGSDCTPSGEPDDDCDDSDDDCDGTIDEAYEPEATTCGVGACAATGTTSCVSGEVVDGCEAGTPAASDATCDGEDDDCDGEADENYVSTASTCGLGVCVASGTKTCAGGEEVDSCDPGDPTAATDTTCNGVDEDCSGQNDEDFVAAATTCGDGVCAATGTRSCVGGSPVDSCDPGDPTAATDTTCNGVDEDCSGQNDEDFVPVATTCGSGVCAATGMRTCVSGSPVDSCDPGDPTAATDNTCNGVDEDCSGQNDEDFVPVATSCGTGVCAATGTRTCVSGSPVDSCDPGDPTAATDTTCDNVDQDCSGQRDEDFVSTGTTCGSGACASTGSTSCVSGNVVDSCTPAASATDDPTCDGVDDDCDGNNDEDYVGCLADGVTVGGCQNGNVVGTFVCNDNVNCTVDTCVPATGSCDFAPQPCADDGYSCTRETCVATVGCQTVAIDADCRDNQFCDGAEVCDTTRTTDPSGGVGCAPALPANVPCNSNVDGITCTDTVCVEDGGGTGHCESEPNDDNCPDPNFCDGPDVCAAISPANGGCVTGSNPCPARPACAVPVCTEATDTCGATVNPAYNCGDGNPCTVDSCNVNANPLLNPTGCVSGAPDPSCTGCTTHADCADVFACTINTCQPNNTCATDATNCDCFADSDCNDGVACTVDTCGTDGQCVHTEHDEVCAQADPQGVCDGADTCGPTGCSFDTTAPLDCDDDLGCTFDSCDNVLGCAHQPDDSACALTDPFACDGTAYCNPAANPAVNSTGCTDPTDFVPCPSDGIACTQELCTEPDGVCVIVTDDDYCIAQPGGCGKTCEPGIGCVRACNITECQGHVYECGDCVDNDGDCRIDSGADDACLGPCSNNESGYAGEIPGQNNAPCKMDCYFDQDTGAGNDDCYWSHSCDPLSVAPTYPPSGDSKCRYDANANIPGSSLDCGEAQMEQSLDCWDDTVGASPSTTGTDYCGDLVPNGCDCFGCCEIPGINYAVYLGSTDAAGNGTCTPQTLTNPALCKPCTQVEACRNPCSECEICVGRPLPEECGCQVCEPGQQLCGSACGEACPDGQFCRTGCCVPVPS